MTYDFELLEEIRRSLRGLPGHPCYECGDMVSTNLPSAPCPGCLRVICQECYHDGNYRHWIDRTELEGHRPCMRGE